VEDGESDDDLSSTAFKDFKVPVAAESRFAIKQGQAVTESVLQPFLFSDDDEMYLVWHKAHWLKFVFQVTPEIIQAEVTIEAPTRSAIKEISASIPEGNVEPLVKRMAIRLPKKIWQDSAKKLDTVSFIGLRAGIMKDQNEIVTIL